MRYLLVQMQTVECDLLIIGGGVIGLSVAATAVGVKRFAGASVILLERYSGFGQETSSRNSEVVHSGIYYPDSSFKTRFCLEGRELLYRYCEQNSVPFAKVGKYVVATSDKEAEYLHRLAAHCESLGVPRSSVTGEQVARAESLVKCHEALFLPETGIVDSHVLMANLARQFLDHDGIIAYGHRVQSVEKIPTGWALETRVGEETVRLVARAVVNAAGLAAAQLSNSALGTSRYEHRFCRGRYLTLTGKFHNAFRKLIYPVPQTDGLGVHVTVDTHGYARLGPDVDWCPLPMRYEDLGPQYDCDWDAVQAPFLTAVNKYCPSLRTQDLGPGQIGIRPKLFIDGEKHVDFCVENLDGWVHCLGIESPGLTSALAIARNVVATLG